MEAKIAALAALMYNGKAKRMGLKLPTAAQPRIPPEKVRTQVLAVSVSGSSYVFKTVRTTPIASIKMTKKSAKAGSSVMYHRKRLIAAPSKANLSLFKNPPRPYLIAKIKTTASPKNWTPVITKEYDAPLADWEKNAIKPSSAQISQEILSGLVLPAKMSLI